jgi:hypothetical protein
MSDDEIVSFRWNKREGVALNNTQSMSAVSDIRFASLLQKAQHLSAAIYGGSLKIRVCHKEAREKAAISVTDQEHIPGVRHVGKVVEPSLLEHSPKREVLQCSVGSRDQVEINSPGFHKK